MTKNYFVTIFCEETIVVQANSEYEAESKAIKMFDATALEHEIKDVWSDDE